ncbi:hypothetical protein Ndes2526B_g06162 [Nannochloris sp. 'desiccata']|nr:putative plastid-lipid-associated protein 1, chloroplastic [Chlorella desiccata (nom. nud.)]
MSAALCIVAPRAAAVGSSTAKKPLTSLEIRAFATPSRQTAHIPHDRCTFLKRSRSMKVAATGGVNDFPEDEMSIEDLKAVLQDTFWGTERGLSADSDTRAEIVELISQLEARNPTPNPNDAIEKLDGNWKLAYTSNSELIALLALGKLPLLTVGEIFQTIDGASRTVENRIQLSAPFSRTFLTAIAAFEVRSPKLLQIEFKEGQVGTPELLTDFEVPSSVDVLGQNVDLSAVKALLQPLDGPVRSFVSQIGSLLSGAPDLKFPIQSPAPSASWLLTTYLDDQLRISRGDGGSVFVLVKEAREPTNIVLYEQSIEDAWQPAVVMEDVVVAAVGRDVDEDAEAVAVAEIVAAVNDVVVEDDERSANGSTI